MLLAIESNTSMTEALANTCMGIGTVFVMLIFISLIISLFGFIPKIEASIKAKKAASDAEPVKAAPAAPKKAPAASGDLMNDAQLVAVITAAIMAASEGAGTTSKDQLIVRSIRRAR